MQIGKVSQQIKLESLFASSITASQHIAVCFTVSHLTPKISRDSNAVILSAHLNHFPLELA
jgi:hypothetical protein